MDYKYLKNIIKYVLTVLLSVGLAAYILYHMIKQSQRFRRNHTGFLCHSGRLYLGRRLSFPVGDAFVYDAAGKRERSF